MDNRCNKGHGNCRLMTEHITFVGDETVGDWRRIVRILGHEEIINIVEEEAINKKWDACETAFQAYHRWCKLEYEKASICHLTEVLETVGRRDVVWHLKTKFNILGKHIFIDTKFTI